MRKSKVFIHNKFAGVLTEIIPQKSYRFEYDENYSGVPVSLTMPIESHIYEFDEFPPFFDGLLPEGFQLEGLVKQLKIDRYDYFSQLVAVGKDLVGAVTVEEIE